MPRPPSSLLRTKLPCAPTVDNVVAMRACEAAAGQCGFHVAARTAGSLVLMPSPKSMLFKCLAPRCGAEEERGAGAGRGITAELVPDENEGLAISVATPKAAGGEAFVSALSAQLDSFVTNSQSASLVAREESHASSSNFRREAHAYYYYSKLLYDTRQAPGQAASEFVQSFVDTCGSLSPTALDKGRLVAECAAAVHRLCALVEAHEAKAQGDSYAAAEPGLAAEFRPWLRRSVERCVYSRVGGPLWSLYEGRHSAEDAQYTEKVQMLSAVSDAALLEALEVRPEFRGALAAAAKGSALGKLGLLDEFGAGTSEMTPSTAGGTEESPCQQARTSSRQFSLRSVGPYERAAAALSQIEVGLCSGRGCTPREIIEALTLSQLEMKTCAFEASAGQMELHAMDDVMPVFIFVLVRSSLLRPFACASFMQDALSQDERLDSEGRAVLLLESAARYVAYDWDISELAAAANPL